MRGVLGKIWTLSTFHGIRSQTSQFVATSQAISSFSAMTTVWKDPGSMVPPYPIKAPGRRITQALALGFLLPGPDPPRGGRGRSKICKAAAQKVSVKRPFKVAQVRLKLQVPEL